MKARSLKSLFIGIVFLLIDVGLAIFSILPNVGSFIFTLTASLIGAIVILNDIPGLFSVPFCERHPLFRGK